MPDLTFWDHLEELRKTIFRCLGVLLALTIVCIVFMPRWFDSVVMAPCFGDFPVYSLLCRLTGDSSLCNEDFHLSIINIKLTSQFMIHMSTSLLFAVVLSFPYLVFEIWRFIAPALYDQEKKKTSLAFGLGSFLFYAGLAVGYFVVFPITLRFLAGYQITGLVANQLSLDSYMSNFISLNLIMGIVFELPMLAMLLSGLGLIDRSFFGRYRRHAIVVLVALAAIITPTGDPFTLTVVSVPLYALYELSALLVKRAPKG